MRNLSLIILAVLTIGGAAQTTAVVASRTEVRIDYRLPEISRDVINLDGREYSRLDFSGGQFDPRSGEPMAPFTVLRVAVPPGASISSQFDIAEQSEISGIDILPAVVVSGLESDNEVPINREIYNSSNPYPGPIVEVSEPYIYRHLRMVDVTIHPIQYYPAQHKVRLLKAVAIRIQWRNGQIQSGLADFTETDRAILQERVVNFNQAQNWAVGGGLSFQKSSVNYDLSVGNWYKIPVSEEGIYKITGTYLRDRNVNIGEINTSTIQMFNYGGAPLEYRVNQPRPADLNELAIQVDDLNGNGIMDNDDAIYFYGRGFQGWDASGSGWQHYLNPYSFTNFYLLTYNQNAGKRIISETPSGGGTAVRPERFSDQYIFEEENQNILESGLDWYWVRFNGISEQRTVNFDLPQNVIPENVQMRIRLKGGSGTHYWDTPPLEYRYFFDVLINGVAVANNITFTDEFSTIINSATPALHGGSNSMEVRYSGNQQGCYAYLDDLEVHFDRPFVAENGFLKFYYTTGPTPSEFSVSGFSGGTNRVWDVTRFADVRAIVPSQNGSTVVFRDTAPQPAPRAYFVFAPATARDVQNLILLPNSPNLRSADRKGKLLIITPDEFYDAAEALENFRESRIPQSIETERVRLSEIFREFSSCVPDPTAIRDFIKYAYDNWGGSDPQRFRPDYILLLGDGSYDYRNVELQNYTNRIPVFEVTANNDIESRVTDNFYTALNNTSGTSSVRPELAIGRLPVNSVADIDNYVRKLQTYFESYKENDADNGWQTVLTFVADDECRGSNACSEWFHLRQTEEIVSLTPHKFDFKKIYLTDYDTEAGGLGRLKPKASADLLDQINRGTLIINYYGHGDPNTWAHEQVLTKSRDLPLIHNGAKLPLWIAATCTWGKYDDPNIPSMAEEMIWSQSGGIGVIAAARPVFAFQNERFVEALFQHLFHENDNLRRSRRLGDAMLMSLQSGSNDQKYHLFADPALRLADPTHQVQINSISADTLKALSTVTVTAAITDSAGNQLSGFDGKALIRVFDSVDSLQDGGGNRYVYQGGTIFRGVVTVQNGQLQGSFIVPKSIKYQNSRTGRISIYAWSSNLRDAAGYNNELLFTGTEQQVNDSRGPNISFSLPNQPDFFDGDFVGQQPTVIVRLSDENGINLTGEVGHRIQITIDGRIQKDVTEFFVYDENSFREGELRYTLPALSTGRHTLTISAWDNLNNYSEEQINFTTSSATDLTVEQVVNYPNPFQEETQFTFQFQSPGGSASVKIKIYTVTGRLIQEIESIARPGFNKIYWDGRDRDGDKLANGVYLYKLVVDDGQKTVEKIDKLAVAR